MQPDIPNQTNKLNCYLPERSSEANSLDDLIQTLTESLIHRLEDLSCSEIFSRLAGIPDPELQRETMLLQEEIQRLKDRLHQL